MKRKYDYIICGTGAAGLSLAMGLCDEAFNHLNVLLIDKEEKTGNDHTWCYWDKEDSLYDAVLSNSFTHINFYGDNIEKHIDIAPYRYKMLQSEHFYAFAKEKISSSKNIEWITADILEVTEHDNQVSVITKNQTYIGKVAFSSIFNHKIDKEKHLYVSQHFKGWFIKTSVPTFDNKTATFMDFRIDQYGECRFFYVLPVNEYEALVEIAIFSNEVMGPDDYDPIIKQYISEKLSLNKYEIQEKEYGVIPMTSYPFWDHIGTNIFPIGAAGGAIKSSSGYAFKRIQEHTNRIIECLKNEIPLSSSYSPFKNKFYLYDTILLDVMLRQNQAGDKIFSKLFGENKATDIFKFLDGKTTYLEEAAIFKTLPLWPFVKGWIRRKISKTY